nr:sensor histidine kinase [Bradyrhizobium sp. U87765 SZCCT0048]
MQWQFEPCRLELGAQACERGIEAPALRILLDLAEQTGDPVARHRHAWPFREILQQHDLPRRQADRDARRSMEHLALTVEPPRHVLGRRDRSRGPRIGRRRGAPNTATEIEDRQRQFLAVDRLGQIKIGTVLVTTDTIVARRASREHDDAHALPHIIPPGRDVARELETTDVGQIDVQHRDVVALPRQGLVKRDAGRDVGDVEVPQTQILRHALPQVMIVLDQDDLHTAGSAIIGCRLGNRRSSHERRQSGIRKVSFRVRIPISVSDPISTGTQEPSARETSADLPQAHGRRIVAALALLILVAFQVSLVAAAERQPTRLPELAGQVSILADPTSTLTLQEILDPARQLQFHPVRGADINFGYLGSAVWVRLTPKGGAAPQAILSLTPNFLDEIDVYTAAPGAMPDAGNFVRHEMGDHRPLPRDGLSGLDNAVRLEFRPGVPTEVYIRIFNTNSSTHLNLQLGSVEERGRHAAAIASIFGIWFGGMGALCITQLVFFYFDRKAQYPLLAFSTLGIILIYMGNLGYSHVYLFPGNGAANDIFIGFNAWAGLVASALAYSSILDLRHKAPLLHRIYQLATVMGLIGIVFAFRGENTFFGPVGTIFSILMALINMVQGLRQMNDEGAASRLRAAAFTALCIGASLSMTQRLGIFLMPDWTVHGYGIAGLVLTILLTGALAIRLRTAEVLNSRMREDALETAQAAEQVAHRRVAEQTRELIAARQVAEDALRAEKASQLLQVRFLEVISHQYRTPLAAIRSSIDSIGLALAPDDVPNRNRIDRIRRAIARLVEMLEINQARSRLQGPSFRPQIVRASAGPIITSAFQRARDLLNGPEIHLSMQPDAAAASIMADAGMLELAIVNLLENAVKYTALKGNTPVGLSLAIQGTDLIIDVTDRGIGIPADDLAGVFANTTRGSNAESVEGSGLGLFLVDKIVRAHNGRIAIDSIENEGTSVRITLETAPA